VASSLFSTAARHGDTASALLSALAILTGVAIGDGALVLFGVLGLWLLVGGLIP